MDKNGKLFGKISIVDLFVVVLLAALAAGIVFRFGFGGAAALGDATFVYTVKIEGVREFTLEYYERGTPVYERFSGNRIGVIRDFWHENDYINEKTLDGRTVLVQRPDRVTLFVEIETPGFQTERSFFTEESFELRVGGRIHLWFRYTDVLGTVVSIEY